MRGLDNSYTHDGTTSLDSLRADAYTLEYPTPTNPWVLANLQIFDRQAFVDTLLEQHHYLPETFRLWILEWPARAVVGCMWPGLPDADCGLKAAVGVERVSGYNWLGQLPATVSTIRLKQKVGVDLVPGICIWSWADGYVWLMLDERESL